MYLLTENFKLLYTNALLRATVCGNLSERRRIKRTGARAQCPLPFHCDNTALLVLVAHILHVIIYIHSKSSRPKQARLLLPTAGKASYKRAHLGLRWRERLKKKEKEKIYIIKASLIKNYF